MDTNNFIWDKEPDTSVQTYRSILGYDKNPLLYGTGENWAKAYLTSQGAYTDPQIASKLQSMGFTGAMDSDYLKQFNTNQALAQQFYQASGLTSDEAKINLLTSAIKPASSVYREPTTTQPTPAKEPITTTSGQPTTATQTAPTTAASQTLNFPTVTGDKFVDYLLSQNKDTSFASRLKVAQQYGLSSYTGTPQQNASLYNLMTQGTQTSQTGNMPTGTQTSVTGAVSGQITPSTSQFQLLGGQNLQSGSSGTNVTELQKFLNSSAGISAGLVEDGKFGPLTKEAVMKFQSQNGLKADGIVGPLTTAKINELQAQQQNTVQKQVNQNLTNAGVNLATAQSNLQTQPLQAVQDIVQTMASNVGLSTMKNQMEETIDQKSQLENELNDKITEISDNPWLSESLKSKKIESLQNKYEGKLQILTDTLALQQGMYAQAMDEIKWTASTALNQYNANRQFDADQIQNAFDNGIKMAQLGIAQAQLKLAQAKAGETEVEAPIIKSINGVDMQWDPATGEWVSPSTTTTTDESQVQNSIAQLDFLDKTAQNALDLAKASGVSGIKKFVGDLIVGDTKYRQLETYANTLGTNVLTLMTDPSIKKFFGPQMTERDVELMISAGTTLNPKNQTPEQLKTEIGRLQDLFSRMRSSLSGGTTDTTTTNSNDPLGLF